MVTVEIDGKKVEVEPGSMVIAAADKAGVWIPRFCYHKKLPIAANCRMCLVEAEKVGKPIPACATPVSEGMKVFTQSHKARDAQKAVMEFLLINHPLDCPICDQGGECELQDIATGYGAGVSRYAEGKISVKDEDLGPLIATDMTRCILCTRCVRFGKDIAGIRELGVMGRGEHARIMTYVKHTMDYEMSGNIIDVCPVGALTSKPYRFKARAWELDEHPHIAAHDCVGSNVAIHTRRHEVMRVVARENEMINETWISDRDRFAYEGLNSAERLTKPMLKQKGVWTEVDWPIALNAVRDGLISLQHKVGADRIGAIATPNATTEEYYLLQKMMRALGSDHIDHRLRETDVSDQNTQGVYPGLGMPVADILTHDIIFIIGAYPKQEQPIINHRIRMAQQKGAKVIVLNAVDEFFNYPLTHKFIVSPTAFLDTLAGIAKALGATLNTVTPTAEQSAVAELFKQAQKPLILLGLTAEAHPFAASLRSLAQLIAKETKGNFARLTSGCNAAGAWLAGCVPHRAAAAQTVATVGLSAQEQLQAGLSAYVLMGVEPGFDFANAQQAIHTLKQAEFVVAMHTHRDETLLEVADVLLPMAAYAETSGTFVNAAGDWQSFRGVATAKGEARPAWKILIALSKLCALEGFDYSSTEEICFELKTKMQTLKDTYQWQAPQQIGELNNLVLLPCVPMYRVDTIVRHAKSLQTLVPQAMLRMNAKTAQMSALTEGAAALIRQGESSVKLKVVIDAKVADNTVCVTAAMPETTLMGAGFVAVTMESV